MATIQSYATPRDGLHAAENDITVFCVMAGVRKWLDALSRPGKKHVPYSQTCPTISTERMLVSLADRPFELKQIVHSASKEPSSEETVLYLGYGSNMSAETFRGKRNIKPISQVNAIIPRLALTFDLPGVPYSEPCFANVRYRHPAESEKSTRHPPYRKDQWTKGLIGVVYEVTKADFAHIIATEGGGAAYQDVLVDCYTLKEDPEEEVPLEPQGPAFKAHTLFCPPNAPRPDPSYAQPSPRYLKLITDGAKEHKLPHEYQEYLKSIGTYRTTTTQQRLGQFIFLAIWAPIFAFIFGGAGMFLDKNGRYPKWYARFATATFTACWQSYDGFFKETFGDGERTVEKEEPEREIRKKEGLVRYHTRDYGAISS